MDIKNIIAVRLLLLLAPLFGMIITPLLLNAEEIRYPIPCYEGDDLAKVRAWEKNRVGQKITPATLAEFKELLPATLYDLLSNPEQWGEYWFEIAPYREIEHTAGEIKFSKGVQGQTTGQIAHGLLGGSHPGP